MFKVKTSLTKKYNFAILSEEEKICFDGFWEAESQYLGGGGDERERIEGIVSISTILNSIKGIVRGGGEDINPPLPRPLALRDSTSLIHQYKKISVRIWERLVEIGEKIVFGGIVVEALLSTC